MKTTMIHRVLAVGALLLLAAVPAAAETLTFDTSHLTVRNLIGQINVESGRGGALIREVETRLRDLGARMLIVETASGEDFEATRRFYRARGFEEEGAVRDFYAAGLDKIVFRKLL